MDNIILELFGEFHKQKISKDEFLNKISSLIGRLIDEDYCIKKLETYLVENNLDMVDMFISIGFMVGFSKKSLPTLCKLLQSTCHYDHEDIAMLLKDFKDVSTIDCLYNATELQFEYLAYDETYQFGRKCIKALSAIESDEAVAKLWLLSKSKIPEIAEYAKKELRYKNLLGEE